MFEQQGSQDVAAVLGSDLVRDHHLLNHLLGDAREGLLVQVQQDRAYTQRTIVLSINLSVIRGSGRGTNRNSFTL